MSTYLSSLSSKALSDLKAGILGVIVLNNKNNEKNGIKPSGKSIISTLNEVIDIGPDNLENMSYTNAYLYSNIHKEMKQQATQYAKDSLSSYLSSRKTGMGGKKRKSKKTRKNKTK